MKFSAQDEESYAEEIYGEKQYLELINKVANIDIEAAVYMQNEMRDIKGFNPCSDLNCIVVWADTPQGHKYWSSIDQTLAGREVQSEIADDPKSEAAYQKLITKVAKINPTAAEYMQHEMRNLDNFDTSDSLWEVVIWSETPQGHAYWSRICNQIEGEN